MLKLTKKEWHIRFVKLESGFKNIQQRKFLFFWVNIRYSAGSICKVKHNYCLHPNRKTKKDKLKLLEKILENEYNRSLNNITVVEHPSLKIY